MGEMRNLRRELLADHARSSVRLLADMSGCTGDGRSPRTGNIAAPIIDGQHHDFLLERTDDRTCHA
jgi:hypothetical protein